VEGEKGGGGWGTAPTLLPYIGNNGG